MSLLLALEILFENILRSFPTGTTTHGGYNNNVIWTVDKNNSRHIDELRSQTLPVNNNYVYNMDIQCNGR